MYFAKPFFGNLAARMQLEDATEWCPTGTTDGRKLYYNRDFIKSLAKKELMFFIAHQTLHGVYNHIGRRGNKKKEYWDMAIDYVVNYTLVKSKIGTIPAGALYSEEFTDEMSADEVYKILVDTNAPIKEGMDMHMSSKEEQENDARSGNGHLTVTGMPSMTAAQLEEISSEVKAAVMSAALSVSAGDIPMGVRRMIDEFTDPKMDWRELLEMHLKSAIKDDYDFTKLSRRSWSFNGKVLFPGPKDSEKIDVVIAIDTSGSMGDEMLRGFLGEVKGIMELFPDFSLKLMSFDTQVYDYTEYTPDTMDELMDFPMRGGGGTDFNVVFDYLKENFDEPPHKYICLTDGLPNSGWGDPDYCDTLFVVHSNPRCVAPFGQTAIYDEDNN